ncbi:hypothetical protein Q2378_26965, partial [Escherichia coli]|nr:hypothetical protein [Escherichia coli]
MPITTTFEPFHEVKAKLHVVDSTVAVKSKQTSVANTEYDINSPITIVIFSGAVFIIGSRLWLLCLTTKSFQH